MLHGDRGSVSVLVAVLVPCLLLVLALVVDGTDRLRTQAHAEATATETARAALTAVDTRAPTVQLDTRRAATRAQHYLASSGHHGSVAITGDRSVQVTVRHTEPAALGLLTSVHTVTGRAEATLGVGTSQPEKWP